MAVSILSNLASFQAQRRLGEATHDLQASFTRLSSGLRVNHGADDASGLSVGHSLEDGLSRYTQGVRNANDAVSLFT